MRHRSAGYDRRGASGSFVFYDSLLPHIARADEIDRVSTAGYALGYLGGGTLLAVNLAWILRPLIAEKRPIIARSTAVERAPSAAADDRLHPRALPL